ncbi:hypothetical protein CYJ10_12535 [Cupriavidus pauculus]|uniref:Uncharacterized protein n=1 Tax=Cupriavidus pauculus TaxID=82633 RepID=A0A2N5CDX5_9BURK|nr:hypothetical protein CYJ10_12535 [Cupriavidus pauculus]
MLNSLTSDQLNGMLLAQSVLIYAILRSLPPSEREAIKIAYAAESERSTEEVEHWPTSRAFRRGFEEQTSVQLARLYSFRSPTTV